MVKFRVSNGNARVGDIVTIIKYGNEERYLYRITGFQEYNGTPQVKYRKVVPDTLEFFPDTIGSWMNLSDAETEMKLIRKESRKLFSRLFR